MTVTAERLSEAMQGQGIDQSALARELGVTQGAISKIVLGKTANSRLMPRIATHLGVSLAWLLGMSDDRGGSERSPTRADNDDADEVEIDSIDLSYGMGGTFLDSDTIEVEKIKFSRSWLRQFTNSPPNVLFSTRGAGDSMMPTIHDRDVVIVDRSQNSVDMGDKVWAVVFGGVAMIKRLRPMPDGTVKISSDNQLVRDELATDGDLFIVGRVIAKVSSL